jgi:hypothetical protein
MQLIDHKKMVTQKITVKKPLAWPVRVPPSPEHGRGKMAAPIEHGVIRASIFPNQ